MGGRYTSLSLDEILEITRVDANHSDELRQQGRGLKALSDKLNESLESMTTSRAGVERGFGGLSADALLSNVTDLVRKGAKGHGRLVNQPDVFFMLAEQSDITHKRMLELRDERDKALEAAKPPERPGIREDYNEQARQYMRMTTAGYVESVKSLEPTKPFDGPRIPRDADLNGPEGIVQHHSTPGPSLGPTSHGTGPKSDMPGPNADSSGPTLQGMTLSPEIHNGVSTGPPLVKNQTWFDSATAGFGPHRGGNPKKSKNKKKRQRRDRDNGTGDGPWADEDRQRGFLPPVIGGRGDTEPEMATTADPAPHSDNRVVPPVIGARESAQSVETAGEPLPRRDGLVPPVIGARPLPMTAPRTIAGPSAVATPAPPASSSPPPRRFSVSPAGVRAVPPDPTVHSAEGRVFGGRGDAPVITAEAADTERRAGAEYTREPKTIHGGPDNPNRAVIRNSRAFGEAPPAEPGTGEPTVTPNWRRNPEEPEFETGPFITNYNLGRSQ